jgi:hypothetical protein
MDRNLAMCCICALAALACSDDKTGETSEPPPINTDSGGGGDGSGSCGGTAPVVEEVRCENTGIQPHYETGEDTVTMRIWAVTSDTDGDLHRYAMQLYFDDVIDGEVNTEDPLFAPTTGSVDRDACEASSAEFGMTLYLPGGNPAWDTLYEWGIAVSDANGDTSEVTMEVCYTPKFDGTDGGPADTAE